MLVKRQQTYLSIVQAAMIAYLFIKDTGWQWYYWLFVVLYPVWMYFDSRFIHGKEIDYEYQKSRMFRDIHKGRQ